MRKIHFLLLFLFSQFVFANADTVQTVRIGIVSDSGDLGFQRVIEWFRSELDELIDGEFNIDHYREVIKRDNLLKFLDIPF